MIIVKVGEPKTCMVGDVWFDPTTKTSSKATQTPLAVIWIPLTPSHPFPMNPVKGDIHIDLQGVPSLWDGNSWIPAVPPRYNYPPANPGAGSQWTEQLSQTHYVYHAGKWCEIVPVGNHIPPSVNVASSQRAAIQQPTQVPGVQSLMNGNMINSITIQAPGGVPLVSIAPNGVITYGPGYTPDAAAQIFWRAIAGSNPRFMQTRIDELVLELKDLSSRLAVAEGHVLRFTQAGHKLPEPPKPFNPDESWERAMGIIK